MEQVEVYRTCDIPKAVRIRAALNQAGIINHPIFTVCEYIFTVDAAVVLQAFEVIKSLEENNG